MIIASAPRVDATPAGVAFFLHVQNNASAIVISKQRIDEAAFSLN